MKLKQGEIAFFDLRPTLGNEESKTRPCIVVSNNDYNMYFNTVLVLPISSAAKYSKQEKYRVSPLFVNIKAKGITGTALLQHLRSIDPRQRIRGSVKAQLAPSQINMICDRLKQFF